jgi:hypothetical protein
MLSPEPWRYGPLSRPWLVVEALDLGLGQVLAGLVFRVPAASWRPNMLFSDDRRFLDNVS